MNQKGETMKTEPNEKNSLISKSLARFDDYGVLSYLHCLGFGTVKEICDLRIYDLMNLNCMSRNLAEEAVYIIYKYLNDNPDADFSMSLGELKQYFDFAAWHRKHPNYDQVCVRDLALEDDINENALAHLFNLTAKAFFKSKEYNVREYRYLDRREYEKVRREQKVHE